MKSIGTKRYATNASKRTTRSKMLKGWTILFNAGADRRVECRKLSDGRKDATGRTVDCGHILITVREVDGEYVSTISGNQKATFPATEICGVLLCAIQNMN